MDNLPTSQIFMSQGLRLHYLDWGNPDAPLLILQHGGRDHAHSFDRIARELSRDWHVVVPDLRGHGDSDWSPDGDYSVTAMVFDFAQLVHDLGEDRITIVGHSLGGNVVTRFAGLYPDRVTRMVNVEGLGFPRSMEWRREQEFPTQLREWIERRRKLASQPRRTYPNFDEGLARMKEANGHLSDAMARHLTLHGMRRNQDSSLSWKFDPLVSAFHPVDASLEQVRQLWSAITCPVLLLWGRESFFSTPDEDGRMTYLKATTLKVYDNAGHWLHHDQYDRFMADVREFLG